MILERGTLLNNRYRIVEILGQGGMGSVYRAVDENLGVEVAVKDNLFTTEEYARQFRREAIILANLRHQNLPRVTDHFVINGQGQYLVMDYIEGEDLRQRMERCGVLGEEEVAIIGAAVCDALIYLGTRKPPIIHRDLKPGNVKIAPQGQIFLVDFGLAKALQGTQATTTGARAMTPGFSPPEQYGTARTDQRSDIFSLGATLYAALTGATPEDSLARAMDQGELTPVRKHNPRVSRRMAAVIEKSLEVRPDDRYQTAEEFKQALLGTNSSARRKEGDFYVTPPPDGEKGLPMESLPPSEPLEKKEKIELPKERSPLLLPISAPIEEAEIDLSTSSRKGKKGRGCWFTFLLLLVLIAIVAATIYRDPGWPGRAYALYWPMLSSYIPPAGVGLVITTPTASNTVEPTYTGAPPTDTPLVPPTYTATLAVTATPTATPAPTKTPTSIPTPLGGGNGEIAFASDASGVTQIYVIGADGRNRRQITDMVEGACQPSWSPDGMRLVFISPCESNTDYYPGSALYIINVDGSGLLPLSALSGGDYDPSWSPDGKKIAFTSLRSGGRPQIYVYDLEENIVISVSEKYAFDFQPNWTPDSKNIIFVTTRRQGQQLWIMDAEGQNPQQFSHGPEVLDSRPSFSPDGLKVIFTQYVALGGIPHIIVAPYTLDIKDYKEFRMGKESLPMRDAVFSSDGFWVAFEAWAVAGSHDIYVVAATGAGLSQVTNDPAFDFDPAWRPLVIP